MNLYFYITKNDDGSVILNSEEQYLPDTFLNVSGFNNLELNDPTLLKDLTWLGRPDLGFWLAIINPKPALNFYEKIVKTTTINKEQKTVTISYSFVNLTQEEINAKKNNIRTFCVPTRDSYLKLTDFTQLSDAPITEQAKNDFIVFRNQLRSMFNIEDYNQLAWPTIPTSAPNITIPPFPPIPSFNG
jgi:hypothetical protein